MGDIIIWLCWVYALEPGELGSCPDSTIYYRCETSGNMLYL